MPEGIEVEYYRQTALRALNREIRLVGTVDQNYLRDGHSLIDIKNLLEGTPLNLLIGEEAFGPFCF